jgi:hypothetical protein
MHGHVSLFLGLVRRLGYAFVLDPDPRVVTIVAVHEEHRGGHEIAGGCVQQQHREDHVPESLFGECSHRVYLVPGPMGRISFCDLSA